MNLAKINEQNARAQLADAYNQLYKQLTSPDLKDVGNYHIIKQIGEGSFGKVYLATHKLLHLKVVLKCGDKNDPNVAREIYYHKQFKHPNIVKLYEIIVTENNVWMVLEYCSGNELYYHIYDIKRVPYNECQKLFYQIVRAVNHVHSINLSHRDLKLENILLDRRKTTIKLSDFGFVRESGQNNFLKTLCGTTVYMAPELIKNEKYSGFAIDSWALGVILYTMLYGEMPFDEDDEMRTKANIMNSQPNFKQDIPIDAINLIKSLLSKDPKQRPTTEEILKSNFLASQQFDGQHELEKKTLEKPFTTKIEKHLLKKLKSLNMDLYKLNSSVLSNKCDQLSAFYELSLEKERRKLQKKKKLSKSRRVSAIIDSQPMEKIMTSLGSRTSSRSRSKTDISTSNVNGSTNGNGNFSRQSSRMANPMLNSLHNDSIKEFLESSEPISNLTLYSTPNRSTKTLQSHRQLHDDIMIEPDMSVNNSIKKKKSITTQSSVATERKKHNLFQKFASKLWKAKHTKMDDSTRSDISIKTKKSVDSKMGLSPFLKIDSQSLNHTLIDKTLSTQQNVDDNSLSNNAHNGDRQIMQPSPLGIKNTGKVRPSSMISQFSHLSQMSAMSESDYSSYSPNIQYQDVSGVSGRPNYSRGVSSEVSVISSSTQNKRQSLISSNSSNSEQSSIKSPNRTQSPDFYKRIYNNKKTLYNEVLPHSLMNGHNVGSSGSHASKMSSLKKAKSPIRKRTKQPVSWGSINNNSNKTRKKSLILEEDEIDTETELKNLSIKMQNKQEREIIIKLENEAEKKDENENSVVDDTGENGNDMNRGRML